MKKVFLLLAFLFSFNCYASYTYISDFSKGADGWEGDFTDFPVGDEKFFELGWGWGNLPDHDTDFTKGLYIKGNNHSDDLFMFFKKKFHNLTPSTQYLCSFSLRIETNIPTQTIGIGGAPGESVFFKIGGTPIEPKKMERQGFYYLNVDKGNQGQGGDNAKIIGDLANEKVDPDHPRYQPKHLSGQLLAQTDSSGKLWLFFGTDSGYEGFTKFYISNVEIQLEPLS